MTGADARVSNDPRSVTPRPKADGVLSENAERLLADLQYTPATSLCPDCAARDLALTKWDVLKLIRELIGDGRAGPMLLCLLPILQEADACRGGPTEGVAAPSLLAVRARLFGAYFTRSAPCHA